MLRRFLSALGACLFLAVCDSNAQAAHLWTDLYYPGWIQQSVPPSDIDFADIDIVDNFSIVPKPDGTLDSTLNGISDSESTTLIQLAHKNGCKVLITLGGETTGDEFAAATQSHEQDLIKNLMAYVTSRGYDGIDLDIEPIEHRDASWTLIPGDSPERILGYEQFVKDLRAQMNTAPRHLLLTAAAISSYDPIVFSTVYEQFDQINIMTYDLAGTWTGQTWFDSGLSPDPGQPSMPSVQQYVDGYTNAGVPASKLGIGIDLEGLMWTGASQPGDKLIGVTTSTVPLNRIMSSYFDKRFYTWDKAVQNSYLSIPASRSQSGKPIFLAYEDIHSASAKADYCHNAGLGGIIVWEMGDGYDQGAKTQPINQVLKAIRKH